MNIPGITRALELDDADWDLAVKLRGLTEHQREQFSAALGPVKAQKKASKKSAGGGRGSSKSARAASLQQQISGRAQSLIQPPKTATDDNEDDGRCTYKIGEDSGGRPVICDTAIDNNVHHKQTDPDYHPFQPAEQAAATSGD